MTMERIFSHFKDGESPKEAVYDPKDPDSYAAYIKSMMGDARDYEDAFLAVDRNHAQLYYYGMEPWIGPYNPGSVPTLARIRTPRWARSSTKRTTIKPIAARLYRPTCATR